MILILFEIRSDQSKEIVKKNNLGLRRNYCYLVLRYEVRDEIFRLKLGLY